MTPPQQQSKGQEKRRPSSMLEVYMEILDGGTGDRFLDEVNMGTGNYTNAEYYKQVETYRKGMYAESAMAKEVMERAKSETKEELVRLIFENPDSDLLNQVDYPAIGDTDRGEYYSEHADDIWASLGTENMAPSAHKAWLVSEVTGLDENWTPPQWKMLKFRHEASASKGARLIDNFTDRVKEFIGHEPSEEFNK
jgi:hypothetical protein